MPSSLKRVLFSLAVLVSVLSATELLSRLVWSETDLVINPILWGFRDHPTLLWMYRPSTDVTCDGCPPMRTNRLGLRGPDVSPAPPTGTLRILSLGESTTFGAFVAEDETYTARLDGLLEQHLTDSPIDGIDAVETINAAVEAWSVWQSRIWLEEVGLSLQPDLILVYHQLNDTLPTGVRDQANFLYQVRQTDRVQLQRRQQLAPLFRLLLRSRAYLALRKTILRLPTDLPTPQELRPTQASVRVPAEDRRAALADMLTLSQQAGAELVILRPLYMGAPHLMRDSLLQDFARDNNLVFVDIPRALGQPGRPRHDLYSDGVHPTTAGHALYAEAISQTLIQAQVLERHRP